METLVELSENIAPGVRRYDDFRSLFQSVEFYMFGALEFHTARGSMQLGTAQVVFSNGIGRDFPHTLNISKTVFENAEKVNELSFWKSAPMTALHELVHTAGIRDSILAQAVAHMKSENIGHIMSKKGFDREFAASSYWDAELEKQCNPDKN